MNLYNIKQSIENT